jgi:O-antigen/teichoic acid export membrane protein
LIGFASSLLAVIVLSPVLVRQLGASRYGAWTLTGGLVNYVYVFDFGLGFTVMRFVASNRTVNDKKAEEAIATALVFVGSVGAAIVVATSLGANAWQRFLGVDGSAFALRCAGVALGLALLSIVLQSAFEGSGSVGTSRIILAAATTLFMVGAVIIAVSATNKLQALGVLVLVQAMLVLTTYALMLARSWDWSVPLSRPTRATAKEVVRFAAAVQAGGLLGIMVEPLSRVLVAAAQGPATVASLDIALRTKNQAFGAGVAALRPLLPKIGHTARPQDGAKLVLDAWRQSSVVALGASLFLAAVVLVVFPPLFGPDIGHTTARLAAVAIVITSPALLSIIPHDFVVIYGTSRDFFLTQGANSVIAMAVTASTVWWAGAWAPILGLGLGACIATIVILSISRKRALDAPAFAIRDLPTARIAYAGCVAIAASAILLLPTYLVLTVGVACGAWLLLMWRDLRRLAQTL